MININPSKYTKGETEVILLAGKVQRVTVDPHLACMMFTLPGTEGSLTLRYEQFERYRLGAEDIISAAWNSVYLNNSIKDKHQFFASIIGMSRSEAKIECYRYAYSRDFLKPMIDDCEAYNNPSQSRMYYESHITIEPVFDEQLAKVKEIADIFEFKVASLLMKKRAEDTAERSQYDTFMTGHGKDYEEMKSNISGVIQSLKESGFKVWRYKIEDTLMDSRTEDVLKLL